MQIKKIPISEINPAPYNPRKISDSAMSGLAESIKKFGLVQPVIVNIRDHKNIVVGGHQRLKALQLQGAKNADCVIVDLDPIAEKALNISLNNKMIEGEFDNDLLVDLLKEIQSSDFNNSGLELDGLLSGIDGLGFSTDEEIEAANTVPEVHEAKIIKSGDLITLGAHLLLCGDCTKVENLEILWGGGLVNLLLTDPPYGVDYSSKNSFLNTFDKGNRNQTKIENDDIKDYRKFFTDFLSIIPFAKTNIVYIFMSGQELHNLRLALDGCDIKWGDYLIWLKNNHVLGRKDYNSKHEFCVYAWKGKHKFYGDFSTTILEFDKPLKNDLHPTMKPVDLLCRLITDGSASGMLVYDPFLGSGSTLIACEKLKRYCRGIEISEKYCEVIIERWCNFTGCRDIKINGQDYQWGKND